ncbi:uncharacterized protein LOC127115231 [Lathyrus oleraceus]|uniref:uncharacterized protein LOC127115231 n=1 Tax=Pisum sativum TaxID=3888 RepID=UPI0021CF77D2|nr:uncharacterized protein LOC127115231 [Pisum sativum]
MVEKAHIAILLSLGDKVLRQVSKETTTSGLWVKLLRTSKVGKLLEHKSSLSGEGLSVKVKFTKRDDKFDKKKGKSQQKSYSGDVSSIQCYHCKKEGHTRKVCPERLKDRVGKDNGVAAIVQDDFDSSDALVVSSDDLSKKWIMDSRCTLHMTLNKDLFEELCDQDSGYVLLGNNKVCKIAGVGSMRFKLHDESIRLLAEVRYAPDLKRNLISLGEFDKKRYVLQGDKSILKVMKGSKEVLRGVKKQGLYTLEAEFVCGCADVASMKPLSKKEIWHMRLDHKAKDETFENLKTWKILEFCNKAFNHFCVAFSIARHETTADIKTAEKAWSGHPSDLEKLRVFGCIAYAHIRQEELEHEEILVKVEHVDADLRIPDQVKEEAQDAEHIEEVEEIVDDYLLARNTPRRVIKPPQRLGYADLIAYGLISASEVLDEEPRD